MFLNDLSIKSSKVNRHRFGSQILGAGEEGFYNVWRALWTSKTTDWKPLNNFSFSIPLAAKGKI